MFRGNFAKHEIEIFAKFSQFSVTGITTLLAVCGASGISGISGTSGGVQKSPRAEMGARVPEMPSRPVCPRSSILPLRNKLFSRSKVSVPALQRSKYCYAFLRGKFLRF